MNFAIASGTSVANFGKCSALAAKVTYLCRPETTEIATRDVRGEANASVPVVSESEYESQIGQPKSETICGRTQKSKDKCSTNLARRMLIGDRRRSANERGAFCTIYV
ncbi:GD14137 [Drosophila simulans]|uniref:GD14137 n=1 Tax=Drosophila simulans TaxID=7240 RepID=B4QMM6_DROSI|nr:GD14137 [Drosophila simulans]